jgi:hypothetical protein
MLREFNGKPVRVVVVWEPVLPTDWGAPSTAALRRLAYPNTMQFWDKGRLISHSMGEHNKKSIVWDHIGVYARGTMWKQAPPETVYAGGPVLDIIGSARTAIAQAIPSR